MKIIITESQQQKFIEKFLMGLFPNDIDKIDVEDETVTIYSQNEFSYKKLGELKSGIKSELDNIFGSFENPSPFKIKIVFEKSFKSDEIEISGNEEDGYEVYYKKGDFELTGEIVPYHSGRDIDYSFEPSSYEDEEYYSDHWEDIEEEILNKFYDFLYEKKKSK
jgi:hypothetical protein